LAVVIDPDRTISAGKVEIGAFRTYPESYKPAGERFGDGYQTIPLSKIEDFGAHSSRYYSLEVSHFKSSLDTQLLELLWNKYWVSTLSQSPLFTNRDYSSKQMVDLSQMIKKVELSVQASGRGMPVPKSGGVGMRDTQLEKVVRDSNKIAGEEISGLLAGVVKDRLFNGLGEWGRPVEALISEKS
jgi:COP9 signalosome complex subunit 5